MDAKEIIALVLVGGAVLFGGVCFVWNVVDFVLKRYRYKKTKNE